MKKLYSYHEQKEVIMLNEDEWKIVDPEKYYSMRQIQQYRGETGCSLKEAKGNFETHIQKTYFELTGIKEPNYELIYKRRISDYGPICKICSRPYRTNKASFCAECGNKN